MEQNLENLFDYDKEIAIISLARMHAGDFSIARKPKDSNEVAPLDHVRRFIIDAGNTIQSINKDEDDLNNFGKIQEFTNDFNVVLKLSEEIKRKHLFPENTAPEDLEMVNQFAEDMIATEQSLKNKKVSFLANEEYYKPMCYLTEPVANIFKGCQEHINQFRVNDRATSLSSRLKGLLEAEASRNKPEEHIQVKEGKKDRAM